MLKKIISFPALIFLLALGWQYANAQAPTDSLNGKTIHLYVQSDDFNAFYFQNGDLAFKKDGPYSYSLTLTGRDLYQQDFFFTSNGTAPDGEHYKWKFGKTGLNASDEGRYQVSDFKGHKEIWIVVDPSGPVTAPPLLLFSAPRSVNILNPWPTTAPKIVSGGKTRAMTTTPGRCGWFTSLILDSTLTKLHFAEVSDADTYGKGGFGSADDFDLAAEFAKGPSIWLNTESNVWTGAWPNVDGECQYMMAATVRDFSKDHPDFEFPGLTGDFLLKGMVQSTIGADRKPVRTAKPSTPPVTFDTFNSWWQTDTVNANPKLRSYESCVDIPMSKSSDGLWEYDSYRDSPTDHSFFPIEGAANHFPDEVVASCYVKPPPDTTTWVTGGPLRNGNFCMESHASFIYQKGQQFAFRGDDDVWVFINDQLVVDLGGVHTPKSDSVDLDKLNLTPGKEYKWDFFYCDRQPCGSSLRVKTSIFFRQQRSLYKEEIPGLSGLLGFKIRKLEGGKGSCASVDTATTVVDPTNLTYQLLDASGAVVKVLGDGTFYTGITIATPNVTVNPNTITELAAGQYRIDIFEPANEKVRVEIPFTVPARNLVEFQPPYAVSSPLGKLVMVVAANMEKGALLAAAAAYTPTIPAGLEVYHDQAKTQPVAAGAALSTKATGYDTLWVTGTTAATSDQTYALSIPLSDKSVSLTFVVPKNRVEFLAPYAHDTLVNSVVALQVANLENGATVAKAQDYSLTIPAGLKVYADAGLTAPILNGATVTTDATGLDLLYATADSADRVDKTYVLEIAGAVKTMTLIFHMPPLDLPSAVSAGIYDDDGDGIGDRIMAVYDRDITASAPKQIGYQWPASAAAVAGPSGADVAKLVAGKNLVYQGKFSPEALTAGNGVFTSTYLARTRDSVRALPLADHIGPIIKSAVMALGKTQDTLRLGFSETMTADAAITLAPADLFGYKRAAQGTVERIAPAGMIWNADRTQASLLFPNTAADEPRSGNLVRINDGAGGLADALGNTAGPASRFRLITGGKRSEIVTVTYREIDPDALSQEKGIVPSLQPTNAVIAEVVRSTGRMGHLIKTDLGAYAVKDDFSNVQPADVVMEYHASYFTNLGVPVNEDTRTIACTDELFQKDCVNNRGYVFVGWNYTAKDGSKAATGAYVARLRYTVKVAGKPVESGGLDQIWGVLRK